MSDAANQIEMKTKRFDYFPKTFVHRGILYVVSAVERTWTTCDGKKMTFRCRVGDRVFDLTQDVTANIWTLK